MVEPGFNPESTLLGLWVLKDDTRSSGGELEENMRGLGARQRGPGEGWGAEKRLCGSIGAKSHNPLCFFLEKVSVLINNLET